MTTQIHITAVRLRIALTVVLVGMFVLALAATSYGLNELRTFASTTKETVANAQTANDRAELSKLKIAQYDKIPDAVDRAEQVVSDRQGYAYQDEAYRDLLAIARRTGVSIQRYSFSDAKPSAQPISGNAPKSPTAPSGKTQAGVASTYITISLENPLQYRNFLNFIHAVEQNLTKMQIERIALSSGSDSRNEVVTDSITLEVFVR